MKRNKLRIPNEAVLSATPNLPAIAEYLSKLAKNQSIIKTRTCRGVWGDPPDESRLVIPSIFLPIHTSQI
jgi:hypothetical protein